MIFKYAFRNIVKSPFLNFIKVAGLSLALGSIIIIVLFLKSELIYDRYHAKSSRIYRFTLTGPDMFEGKHFARIYGPNYIPEMARYFPGIENYVRLVPVLGGSIKFKNDFIKVNEGFQCDSTFFEVFDSEFLVGNPDKILDNPGSMVVSESFARRVFGNINPVGQVLTLPEGQYYGKAIDFTVKGVMKDFPQNSHFHPEFLTTPGDKSEFSRYAWTYLLLSRNADPGKIVSTFKEFYKSHVDNQNDGGGVEAHLQPVSQIHLHSNKLREIESNGNMSTLYTLSLAALLLLFIAVTNYTNLNIGMADSCKKYLFITKVSGSSVRMNLEYFIAQGIYIILFSTAGGLILAGMANIIIQKYFSIDLFTNNLALVFSTAVLFGLIAIISGISPLLKQGLYLKPVTGEKTTPDRKGINKTILVIQFTISIALIIALIVIHRQTGYALRSSMGSNDLNLICVEDVHSGVQTRFHVFKDELLKFNSVRSVSAMLEPPAGEANDKFEFRMSGYVKNENNKADNYIGILPCDYSFARIFGLDFIAGTNFSERYSDNEGSGEYIVNESAMRRLHFNSPGEITGKDFKLVSDIDGLNLPSGKIIGVVRDFHLSSMKKQVEPLVLFKREDLWLLNILISPVENMQTEALASIKKVWSGMFPQYPFQYQLVNTMYRDIYKTELLQGKLLSIFTLIAFFICSAGLLGLSLLTTQRRTKEIGIRKINGAGTGEIVLMLYWDIVRWIVISFLLAIPLSYFLMSKWLESFAYQIALSWWIFVSAGLTAIFIAVATVSLHSLRAANQNPVDSLRYE